MSRHRTNSGFTLIELMLVAAIIGLLAAIAVPKFGELIQKAKESALKGKIGSIRSTISIYYADNEGMYPYQAAPFLSITHELYEVLVPKYASREDDFYIKIPLPAGIPAPPTAHIGSTNNWAPNPITAPTRNNIAGGVPDFTGAAMYCPMGGDYFLLCTHLDVQGHPWSEF